jgi:hypothetical protein
MELGKFSSSNRQCFNLLLQAPFLGFGGRFSCLARSFEIPFKFLTAFILFHFLF